MVLNTEMTEPAFSYVRTFSVSLPVLTRCPWIHELHHIKTVFQECLLIPAYKMSSVSF